MTIDTMTPEAVLAAKVQTVGEYLGADRCFLYVRQPDHQRGRIAFCWRENETIPDVIQPNWQDDVTSLPDEDPLFRAGLHNQPSVYVEDVETAPADVLNRDFERRRLATGLWFTHIFTKGDNYGEFYSPASSGGRATGLKRNAFTSKRCCRPCCPSSKRMLGTYSPTLFTLIHPQ